MNILFLTRKAYPHIGGVEKHVNEIHKNLEARGELVKIVSEDDIKYPHTKFFGLLYIWIFLFKNRQIIKESDIVHVHDVFVWYLPFKFLYFRKKVFTTFHGWEESYPIPFLSRLQKVIAWKLSKGSIVVGKYVEKHYGIKGNILTYGAIPNIRIFGTKKTKDTYVYVGRLEENTGLDEFLKWLDGHKAKWSKVDFVGDGRMRKQCAKYGTVHGLCDPTPYLKKAEYCVAGGYLAALEGLSYDCKLKLFWNNQVKKDYWQMSPFTKKNVKVWSKSQTWEKLANEYISLYHS